MTIIHLIRESTLNLLKKLSTLFAATAQGRSGNLYSIAVQCKRCGEIVHAQINLANEPSIEYDEAGNPTGYICRKTLMGKQRCFQQIEVVLTFNARHKLVDRQVENGVFVDDQAASEA